MITKLTEAWTAEQHTFAGRDLSGVDYVYLWADGIHVNIRQPGWPWHSSSSNQPKTTGAWSTRPTWSP